MLLGSNGSTTGGSSGSGSGGAVWTVQHPQRLRVGVEVGVVCGHRISHGGAVELHQTDLVELVLGQNSPARCHSPVSLPSSFRMGSALQSVTTDS